MDSAEGQVQNLKYTAAFPLLLNISDQPTYFMALKDGAGLVKKYAMVNVQKYQNVAIGDTVQECEKNYEELLESSGIDEARILTEAALFADRIAIDEETVRLHSHLKEFAKLLEIEEPVGRKLDFMVQEMNRETNTIGSKANDLQVTGWVVAIKSEIEKIREQIQNLE